jgi:hypothetical protein
MARIYINRAKDAMGKRKTGYFGRADFVLRYPPYWRRGQSHNLHLTEGGMIPGLSQQEVERRRKNDQGNVSASVSSRSYLHIVRKNVFTFVNMVLLTIGALLVLLGSPGDPRQT